MNSIDEKISQQIWPQHARPLSHPKPEALANAKAYLGDRYLVANPINKRRVK